jgi:hypothetical protein
VRSWNPNFQASFEGRLQGAQQILHRLNGAFRPSIGGTLADGTELADCLRKS